MKIEVIPGVLKEQELLFVENFNDILKKHPFKVYDLLKVFRNADITYARDSTLIITLAKLRELMVKDLFEILNIFYQNNHIKKLIYKKEFLIIHFTSRYSLKVLCDKTYYMYIDYYFFFKDKGLECYLNPIISIQNIKEEVDLVFKYKSEYYIFTEKLKILPFMTYYIDLFIDFDQLGKRKYLKYYLSNMMKEEEFLKITEEDNY